MTYNVSSGMLNTTIPYHSLFFKLQEQKPTRPEYAFVLGVGTDRARPNPKAPTTLQAVGPSHSEDGFNSKGNLGLPTQPVFSLQPGKLPYLTFFNLPRPTAATAATATTTATA